MFKRILFTIISVLLLSTCLYAAGAKLTGPAHSQRHFIKPGQTYYLIKYKNPATRDIVSEMYQPYEKRKNLVRIKPVKRGTRLLPINKIASVKEITSEEALVVFEDKIKDFDKTLELNPQIQVCISKYIKCMSKVEGHNPFMIFRGDVNGDPFKCGVVYGITPGKTWKDRRAVPLPDVTIRDVFSKESSEAADRAIAIFAKQRKEDRERAIGEYTECIVGNDQCLVDLGFPKPMSILGGSSTFTEAYERVRGIK